MVRLEDVLAMLGETRVVILATVAGFGNETRPAARAMTLRQFEGALYMLTFPDSPKVAQIRANPRCLVYSDLHEGKESGFVRLDCTAAESADPDERRRVFESSPYAGSFWSSPEDPGFCLLRLTPVGGDVMRPGEMWAEDIDTVR